MCHTQSYLATARLYQSLSIESAMSDKTMRKSRFHFTILNSESAIPSYERRKQLLDHLKSLFIPYSIDMLLEPKIQLDKKIYAYIVEMIYIAQPYLACI